MVRMGDLMQIGPLEVTERCARCGKATEGKAMVGGRSRSLTLACDCSWSERENARNERVRRFTKAQYRTFGGRLPNGSFKRDDGRNEELAKVCKSYADTFSTMRDCEVNGLLLYGEARQGKTFMAEAIANTLLWDGYSVMFTTAAKLIHRYQYGDRDSVRALESRIAESDLVIIDDLGAHGDSSFRNEIVFSAIDTRYAARKPLVITTNAAIEDMAGDDTTDGKRLYGRIIERCKAVKVDSGSTCAGGGAIAGH